MRIITALLLVVMILCGVNSAFAQEEAGAKKILDYYQNKNYRELYNNMSVDTLTVMPYEGMVAVLNLEKQMLGELTGYEQIEKSVTEINSQPQTTFRYVADFERGQGFIILTLVKERNKIKVLNFHIDSPAFLKSESKGMIDEFAEKQEYFPTEE